MFLVHRRDIIEAIKIRQGLQIGLMLNQLFRPAVQQTNMRINALYDLPVKLQHKAQHAMGRRMLRAEINGEITIITLEDSFVFSHGLTPPPLSHHPGGHILHLPMGT